MSSPDPSSFVPSLHEGEYAEDDETDPNPPAWAGRPVGIQPGAVPIAVVLGESPTAAVLLTTVKAYPTGVSLIVSSHLKNPADNENAADPISDGRLRLTVELPDGQVLTGTDPLPEYEHPNAQRLRPFQPEDADWSPDHAVLRRAGGTGSASVFEQAYWLWPLPITGTLLIRCEWLEQGIHLCTHEFDGSVFSDAAAQACPVRLERVAGAPFGSAHVDRR